MSKTFYWSVVGFFLRHRRPGQEGAKYRDEGEYGISQ